MGSRRRVRRTRRNIQRPRRNAIPQGRRPVSLSDQDQRGAAEFGVEGVIEWPDIQQLVDALGIGCNRVAFGIADPIPVLDHPARDGLDRRQRCLLGPGTCCHHGDYGWIVPRRREDRRGQGRASQFDTAAEVDHPVLRGWVADAPSLTPGDTLEIDGSLYRILGAPVRDATRLVWTAEAREL